MGEFDNSAKLDQITITTKISLWSSSSFSQCSFSFYGEKNPPHQRHQYKRHDIAGVRPESTSQREASFHQAHTSSLPPPSPSPGGGWGGGSVLTSCDKKYAGLHSGLALCYHVTMSPRHYVPTLNYTPEAGDHPLVSGPWLSVTRLLKPLIMDMKPHS